MYTKGNPRKHRGVIGKFGCLPTQKKSGPRKCGGQRGGKRL